MYCFPEFIRLHNVYCCEHYTSEYIYQHPELTSPFIIKNILYGIVFAFK